MKIRREERKDGGGKDEVTVKCFSHKEKKVLMHTQSLQDYYVEVGTDHL